MPRPHILHCHSTFAPGGKELRSTALINAFGDEFEHTIVSGDPAQTGAFDHVAKGVTARLANDFPRMDGLPTPGRLVAIAHALKQYDLVCTYNWGAINVVMAHTVFAETFGLPPLIHHEDGFNEDEATRIKTRRNWFRRAALGRTHRLVVPSATLEAIALGAWGQPRARVVRIANGIDTAAFGRKPRPGAFRVVKRDDERWVGTIAGLRPVKQLEKLVEACRALPEDWHLVILGEGPQRDTILARAAELEMSHRVHLPGATKEPEKLIGLFDIFALSSRSEQFPLSVVEAMAAGLPVAAPDVGDVRAIVSEENRPFIAVPDDTEALSMTLTDLAKDEELRKAIGKANRCRAREHFDRARMIADYRAVYQGALAERG